jgi:hypothetical protein
LVLIEDEDKDEDEPWGEIPHDIAELGLENQGREFWCPGSLLFIPEHVEDPFLGSKEPGNPREPALFDVLEKGL